MHAIDACQDQQYSQNYDDIVLYAIEAFLRNSVQLHDANKGKSHLSDYHFSFLVPTSWDYDIREELIRHLFIQTGLITESDHKSRLLFFTKIESFFQYLQSSKYSQHYPMYKVIGNGKQYIVFELYFAETNLSVDIDLFSAHYLPATAIDEDYVTNHSSQFALIYLLIQKLKLG